MAASPTPADSSSGAPILSAHHVTKRFDGVTALDDVGVRLFPGEVHVLAGENGSGKSTLLKCLAGALKPDAGSITLDGSTVELSSVRDAAHLGVVLISQELSLATDLSVGENIFMGHRAPKRHGRLDWNETAARAESHLAVLGVDVNPRALVRDLKTDQRQLVEIARALSYDARVILMDEPTSSLDTDEVKRLLRVMRDLADRGVAVAFISHRMPEMLDVGDRFTVLRDGELVGSALAEDVDESWLIRSMVGRNVSYPAAPIRSSDADDAVVLDVSGVSDDEGRVKEVSFRVSRGEVIGLAGLVGAGRTEVLELVAGVRPKAGGSISLLGEDLRGGPRSAIDRGVVLVPEDRSLEGIFPELSVFENMLVGARRRFAWFRRRRVERAVSRRWCERLSIKTASELSQITSLSGGSQQKVILARCLERAPRLLLLDEPTRGIDISARIDIYELINELAESGMSVVVASSEIAELRAVAHRVLVMNHGHVVADIPNHVLTEELVISHATGAQL